MADREPLLTRTKIVATIGPASREPAALRDLIAAGVDVIRLNFAHGTHDEKAAIVQSVRAISAELKQTVALLGDLSGPKIRLGELPEEGLTLAAGERCAFVREGASRGARDLTSSYSGLVEDLRVDDRVLLADGSVSLRVIEKTDDRATCLVEQSGKVFSRQGINLPGGRLRLGSLTDKDLADLKWALAAELDFIGLSFVRSAEDVRDLRKRIEEARPRKTPFLVAKIEKPEAVEALDEILAETDVAMVARGDLGVEADIVRVPVLQKKIIAACNRRRVPVITATQMLESMKDNELPTRAEATDVANAVLDGTDAVMLSAETAVGKHPPLVVSTMSRIARDIEPLLVSRKDLPIGLSSRSPATETTIAVTLGAVHTAERLGAKLLVLVTRTGVTATAVSELRSPVPILALTDDKRTAARMAVTWGVRALLTNQCRGSLEQVAAFVQNWGIEQKVLASGDRFVLVGTTNPGLRGKNLMIVHAAP